MDVFIYDVFYEIWWTVVVDVGVCPSKIFVIQNYPAQRHSTLLDSPGCRRFFMFFLELSYTHLSTTLAESFYLELSVELFLREYIRVSVTFVTFNPGYLIFFIIWDYTPDVLSLVCSFACSTTNPIEGCSKAPINDFKVLEFHHRTLFTCSKPFLNVLLEHLHALTPSPFIGLSFVFKSV